MANLPFVAFHVQDAQGRPINGALLQATSPTVGPWQGVTNPCGDFFANLSPAHYDLIVSAPGFVARELPADIADCGLITIGLEPDHSTVPVSVLRFDGDYLVNEHGPIPIRAHSFFLGILRHRLGEDIRPAIRYARDVAGSNTLRVFVYMKFVPELNGLPVLTPEDGLASLPDFLAIARDESMYVEITAGDAKQLQPDVAEQRQYFAKVATVLQKFDNRFLLELNEPWKNGLDPFLSLDDATGVFRARGSSAVEGDPYEPRLDAYDQHTERSLAEDGYKWVRHQWEMHHFARAYHEEPMGCGERQIDGRRDNNPAAFAQGAIVGEGSGVGWCFHSDYGIEARLPDAGSSQDACAHAVGAARRWFRPETQTWKMTRAGLADSAVVLDDAHALRVYQRLGDTEGQAVAVHPEGYVAVGQNGWRIVNQSADGAFIDLAR